MRSTAERPAFRYLTATALALAGASTLGYAVWLLTARRAIFAEIEGPGAAAVSMAAARASDDTNAAWLWTSTVLLVVALALWLVVRVASRQRFGPVGFAGACMAVAGLLVVPLGSYLASLAGGASGDAQRAATGYAVMGAGFCLTALGLFAGVVSLVRGPAEPTPYLGYAGWDGTEDRDR